MSTHSLGGTPRRGAIVSWLNLSSHWTWLGIGGVVAFGVPFLFADVLDLDRDVFYGVYALSVAGLLYGWAHATGYDLRAACRRRLPLAIGLGLVAAAVLAGVVSSEAATSGPAGVTLAAAIGWRGFVYGVADGLLLSAFPILAIFAAFTGSRLSERARGKVAIGAVALLASLAMTAVYHLGYSEFRSEKLRKPLVGDAIWSVPTLVTLNPVGAPIAHVGLHVTAVLHSYETDTFLPPH